MKTLQDQEEQKAFEAGAVVAPVILKAVANGNIIEAHYEAATVLIANGIYTRASLDEIKEYLARTRPPTAVKPLTTSDMPKQPKKGKPIK